ncbi:MAG: hypothetical protein R3E66_06425 [bacterium]
MGAATWQGNATQRNATQRNATQRNATQRNATKSQFWLLSLIALAVGLLAFVAGRLLSQRQPTDSSSKSADDSSPKRKPGTGLIGFADRNDDFIAVHSFRPDAEWQGMAIDESDDGTACHPDIGCGLGLACVDGRCVGCADSADCMEGEACVLQHCLLEEMVSCVGRTDCGADELCVLSGVSGDARGNSEMHSFCMSNRSGFDQVETAEIQEIQNNIQDVPQFRMSSRQVLTNEIQQ